MMSIGAGGFGAAPKESTEVGNTTWVCWSAAQQLSNANRDCRIHIQRGDGFTLCGVKIGMRWEYEVHDYPPQEFGSCRRCQRAVNRGAA